ncbi:hypothetical protein DSO57_1010408 [Entomophthora muscae]|uniref:Uncharacterized protein n=1 Tax=Entomophthora muscae TaxID=34485 RepID=A0ACC2RL87_9FUNG|nr:hypothetical protein DSO57_1010408 [Entomophthora muscae]
MFCRFTAERVISVARNLLTELEEFTRDGASLAWAIKSRMLKEGQSYDTRLDSSISIFRQEEFLTDVIIGLSKPATATQVLAQLEGLRDILVLSAPNEGILQLGVPLRSHKDPEECLQEFDECWKKWLERFKPHGPLSSSVPRKSCGIAKRTPYTFPKDISYHPCLNLAVGSLTSSYIVSIAPCDVFTTGNDLNPQDHVSKMAVLVMSELLSRCNGPLFELIRGQGLAYHVDLYLNVWAGALVFDLHDSVDPTAALIAFWGFLSQLMEPEHWNETITQLELQLAKSSLLYISTRIVGSPSSLLSSSFKYSLWGFKSGDSYVDHYREYLDRVTLADLKAVFLKYFCQFLDPSKTQIVMLTPDPTAISEDCSSDTEGDSSMTDDETIDSATHEDYKPLAALADNAYGFSFQDGSMEMF